jgi:citrate lyase beta subunit
MVERPRRSLLYVPASVEAMVRKAGTRGADVLILDLEDGVHPDAKERAREALARLYREVDFGGAEALVRINPPASPWGAGDLEMAADLGPAGVVLPKSSDPSEVAAVGERLGLPLYLMVETAEGVLAAPSLARCPGVAGLVFGAADYRESLRAGRHPEELELLHARGEILLAARAAGAEAFDTPWFEYRDLAGLEASARRARQLGFDGKTAVHPGQVGVINRVFAPSPAEVERARRILAALEEAAARGRGVATLDGEMVEALHAREARRVLARSR